MKVPKIRFKGFEGAWEEEKLWNLWKTYTWLSWKTKNDFWHGEWLFIPYINIFSNTIVNERKLEQVEIDKNQNEVMYWDFFFTTSSETPKEVWMTSVRLGNKENIYLNSFCFWYRFSIDINYYFTSYMFRSNVFREKIILLAQWISRYNISKNKTLEISISLPSLREQEKIWALFEQLDSHISKNQQKLEKLKNMKQSFLQKLFPKDWSALPELRFKGFEEAWEERKLGEICQITMWQSPDWSTYSNKKSDYILVQWNSDLKNWRVVPRIRTTQKTKTANVGDLIMSVRAPAWAIWKTGYDIILWRWVASIKGNDFVFYFLVKLDTFWYWKRLSAWSTFDSINSDSIQNLNIYFPSLPEQKKIWAFFEKLDTQITHQSQKIQKLQNIKQSLLEKMFI